MTRLTVAACLLLFESAFGAGAQSSPLPGFEPMQTGPGAPGLWRTVEDADAPGTPVVEQTSDDPTDGRFPLLIRMETAPANVTIRARIKPMAGSVD